DGERGSPPARPRPFAASLRRPSNRDPDDARRRAAADLGRGLHRARGRRPAADSPAGGPAIERVVILGSGGAGKTRLALALGECTGLPVVHLDPLFWRPN